MTTRNDAELAFPFHSQTLFEPPGEFATLRDQGGLARVRLPTGDLAWLATRYEDVREVLASPALSRAAATAPGAPRLGPVPPETRSLAAMDAPEHTRLRRLVVPAFSAGRIERLRPRIQQLVDGLLDAVIEQGPPADLVTALGKPLPMMVICELLGVPACDQDYFTDLAERSLRIGPGATEDVRDARELLHGYFAELIETRRFKPAEDLVSQLVSQSGISDSELATFCSTVLTAGYRPVSNVLTGSVVALLRHPVELDRLLAEASRLRSAVDELLRYVPGPVSGGTIRVATEDVVIGGTLVRAGEAVLPSTTSANRDEDVFADPDRLDVSRVDNPHVTFGPGIHHCLGAALARTELTVVLGTLLRRLPGLAFAVPASELAWTNGTMIRALTALPVTW
ncbi:MAG TPA: cytochrome P450 [Pseudonocardiaceae bacterium]|nr:cytochrome P450 [Pseudonocardiaceae bacterium]